MRRHLVQPLPLLTLLATALLAACGGEEPAQEPAVVYASRGIVRQLPKAPRGGAELRILHEAMPDFRSQNGDLVGMESMSMPFPVAEAEIFEGLAVGDRVRFEFEVRWEGEGSPLLLTHIEKLPPDTRLGFEGPPQEDLPDAAEEAENTSTEGEEGGGHGG